MSMPRRKMKRKPKKRRAGVNKTQRGALVSTMEKRKLFARKQISKLGPRGYLKWQSMWIELAKKLNGLGPCRKTWKEWEKFWTDLRRSSRIKTTRFVKELKRTGHDDIETEINDEEESVTKIFGKPGLGLALIQEAGIKYFRKIDETVIIPGGLHYVKRTPAMTSESSLINSVVQHKCDVQKDGHKRENVGQCINVLQPRPDLIQVTLRHLKRKKEQVAMLRTDVESLYDSLADFHATIDNCIDAEVLGLIPSLHG